MVPEKPDPKKADRFQTVVTVLIALVSTIIALVASQAAQASGNATEAQHDGVLAKINLERVDGASRTQIAQNERAFSEYLFNNNLYTLTFQFIGQAETAGNSAQGTRLRLEAAAQLDTSDNALNFINRNYLIKDASGQFVKFDDQNFLNAQRQDAAIYENIDYTGNFATANQQRAQSIGLSLSLVVWFVALMFLTWAEITKSNLRWLWLLAGVLLGLGITVAYMLSGVLHVMGLS
jgi:hypothetical protein